MSYGNWASVKSLITVDGEIPSTEVETFINMIKPFIMVEECDKYANPIIVEDVISEEEFNMRHTEDMKNLMLTKTVEFIDYLRLQTISVLYDFDVYVKRIDLSKVCPIELVQLLYLLARAMHKKLEDLETEEEYNNHLDYFTALFSKCCHFVWGSCVKTDGTSSIVEFNSKKCYSREKILNALVGQILDMIAGIKSGAYGVSSTKRDGYFRTKGSDFRSNPENTVEQFTSPSGWVEGSMNEPKAEELKIATGSDFVGSTKPSKNIVVWDEDDLSLKV